MCFIYRLMILSVTISHISKFFCHQLPFLLLLFTQVLPHGNWYGAIVYGLKVSLSSHKSLCSIKSELWRISPLTTWLHSVFTDSSTFSTGFTDGKRTASSAGLKSSVVPSKPVSTLISCTGTMCP